MIKQLKKVMPQGVKELYKDIASHNFINNYFGSRFQKRVLISYINNPFIVGNALKHTNYQEAIAIADVFNELGYCVDLINYTKKRAFKTQLYDVVFGLGEAVEYALMNRDASGKKPFVIWHGTGSSPFFSNPITIKRLRESYGESGKLFIESTRFLDKVYPLSYVFADLIVLYGNEFTRNTYLPDSCSPIEKISPTTHFVHIPVGYKDRKNYVWFGSKGVIHKGLDLLINYFFRRPDINLYICGDVQAEEAFYSFYKDKIETAPNIYYEGFVDVSSKRFSELMDLGTFSILPSCSEGIATSVLTTMANGGMIPIVTANSGVDLNDYGIEISSLSIDGVDQAIRQSEQLTEAEIARRVAEIIKFTRANYTVTNFSKNLKLILTKHIHR